MTKPTKKNQGFLKSDKGKPRHSLLPQEAIAELVRVLEYGAKKYKANNWRKGCDWLRYYDACQRHLTAWIGGEDFDEESHLSHLGHAMCCLAFLVEMDVMGFGEDDRVVPGPPYGI